MCLIAHRPINSKRGSNIPNEVIDHNLAVNPDGFGLAWRDSKRGLVWEKFAPTQWAEFRALLKEIDRDTTIEYVAHWRLATHGEVCAEMSHPFPYTDAEGNRVLVFHNGVIDIKTEGKESDTAAFVRKILAGGRPRWWHEPKLLQDVEDFIGWSRLAVMTDDEVFHVNEIDWVDMGGLRYSTYPRRWTYSYTDWKDDENEEDDLIRAHWPGDDDRPLSTDGLTHPSQINGLFDLPKGTRYSDWYSAGHPVTPLKVMRDPAWTQDDLSGTALCEECRTEGEFYVIDKNLYINIGHVYEDELEVALVAS